MTLYEIVGFMAAILTTAAFLPQVIKSFMTKQTKDLSFGLLALQSSGCFFWIIYGVAIHSPPVYVANIITLFLVSYLLILKIRHLCYEQ